MSVLVSVVCNTYNQRSYIRNALDGFLMQKTTFPIEILVHDDASTDGTAQIVREYAEKHPNLIKPILQTENQYSKNVSISSTIQFPRAEGKYIAFCEGDDYWTDPLKLQKQVEALEAHPEIDICAHQAATVRDEKRTGVVPAVRENTIFSAEEVIAGGGGFVSTASLMFRKELFDHPYEFSKQLSLDYIWQISGSLRGGMLYLGDCMSVYRQKAKGSWTEAAERNPEAQMKSWRRIRDVLVLLNEETNQKYAAAIETQIAMMDLNPWIRCGELRKVLSKEGRALIRLQTPRLRVLIPLFTVRRWLLNRLADRNG